MMILTDMKMQRTIGTITMNKSPKKEVEQSASFFMQIIPAILQFMPIRLKGNHFCLYL
jgi:hypothetical protein